MRPTESRKLKQYGWISGPVECRCTACDWGLSFVATDSSVPLEIANAFERHNCAEHAASTNSRPTNIEVSADRPLPSRT